MKASPVACFLAWVCCLVPGQLFRHTNSPWPQLGENRGDSVLCRQSSLQPLDAHCTTSADEVPSNCKESAQGLEELCSSPPMIWESCLFELPLQVLVWPWLSTTENTICGLGVTAWQSFVTTMEINDSSCPDSKK